jgi:hypothetical protein
VSTPSWTKDSFSSKEFSVIYPMSLVLAAS